MKYKGLFANNSTCIAVEERQLTPIPVTGLLAKSEDLEGEGDCLVTGSLLQRVSYQIDLATQQ